MWLLIKMVLSGVQGINVVTVLHTYATSVECQRATKSCAHVEKPSGSSGEQPAPPLG